MDYEICLNFNSDIEANGKAIIELFNKAVASELVCFSTALILLKSGFTVSRRGWNEGVFVFMDPEHTTNGYRNFTGGKTVKVNPSLLIKNADKSISHWNPSNDDLLSEDWFLILNKGKEVK